MDKQQLEDIKDTLKAAEYDIQVAEKNLTFARNDIQRLKDMLSFV